jgi:hypothetical protein
MSRLLQGIRQPDAVPCVGGLDGEPLRQRRDQLFLAVAWQQAKTLFLRYQMILYISKLWLETIRPIVHGQINTAWDGAAELDLVVDLGE